MNQAAQVESITSGVNEARFLDHLRSMFSTSTTVLAETMQNARRAEAASVSYDYDQDSKSLIITDSGIGIDDFRALITVAESGWSEETMQSESPFGMGFFSVCFAAESVVVESRGKAIAFTADDLIAKRQISILPSSFIGGTRITLQQCKLEEEKIESSLKHYAKGFSIPVIWKNEALPQPHAQSSLSGITTDIGFLHVPPVHGDAHMDYRCHGHVYCQGLPIVAGDFSINRVYGNYSSAPVIHIDHQVFFPRMPDRDCLINQDEAAEQLSKSVRQVWKDFLEAEKTKLQAEVFAERYWRIAQDAGLISMMNDVPYLPPCALTEMEEMPILYSDGESFWRWRKTGISMADVKSGSVVLADDLDVYDDSGDTFAKLTFALQTGTIFVSSLPDGHWAHEFVIDLDETKAKIGGKVVAKGRFNGRYTSGEVKVVDNLTVTLRGMTVTLEHPISLGSEDWGSYKTFLVPKGQTHAGYVLRQASTYTDGCDHYQETDFDLDSDEFDDLLAILNGESGQDTLTKCLESVGIKQKTNLRNTAYRVAFDADGNITVEAL